MDAFNVNSSTRSRKENKNQEKSINDHSGSKLLCGKKRTINVFKSGIFPVSYIRFSFSDHPEKTLMSESPSILTTPPVVLEQTLGS